ncbi:MAG TPA: T9SS type A sorting domain-containing protein [Flavobacteriales bacterium]|nr:T9SS type A sorting domain-containing protein [Flavobacteriales bacterium]
MKHVTLLAAVFASASFGLNAQTINSNWAPNSGFSQTYNVANISGSISPGSTGASQSWNFASLSSDSVYTETYGSPAAAPGGSSFPTSTVASQWTDGSIQSNNFYLVSSSLMQVVGSFTTTSFGNITISFSDPMDYLRFPCNLNDAYVDSFYSSINATTGLSFQQNGRNSVTVDGSGSLTTPVGTFTNVLRVKSVEEYTNFGLPPIPGSSNTGTITNYYWISSSHPGYYLMRYTIEETPTTVPDTSISYVNPGQVGINDLDVADLNITPNPANELIAVNFTSGQELAGVEVLDLSGRVVAKESIIGKMNIAVVSTSHLNNGMYILRATNAHGASVTTKIFIAH